MTYLDHGAELEARDDEWRSRPLGWAANEGRLERVVALLPHDEAWATLYLRGPNGKAITR